VDSENADCVLSRTGLLFVMWTVPWYGAASCKLKLHFPQQRPSISPCLMPYARQFQFKISSERFIEIFIYQIQWLTSTSLFTKTTYQQ
jgi:hypothetical protein